MDGERKPFGPQSGTSLLTQLTRLAQRRDQALTWLDQALLRNLDLLAPVVLEVAVETGDPIGRVLAGRVDDLSLELTLRLMSRCNDSENEASLPLREVALELNRRCVAVHRDQWPDLDDEQTNVRAGLLNNLGLRLNAVGRFEDALEATREAVGLRRRLAEQNPEVYSQDLALNLHNLGGDFSAVGRHEDALEATQEAVDVRRRLAEEGPAAVADLARSLHNLGNDLGALGRHQGALGVLLEAVERYRELRGKADGILPELARSLTALGSELSALDRHEEAVEATFEAIELRRELAAARPDAYLPSCSAKSGGGRRRWRPFVRRSITIGGWRPRAPAPTSPSWR